MAEIHEQLQSEGVTREDYATWVRGAFNFPGRLYLTGRRLVFLQVNPLFMAFGAIGAALGVARKPKKLRFDIPVNEISDVSKDKVGLAKNVLAVRRSSGEVVKFNVKNNDEWAEALRSARAGEAPST
jgi:hypothetical protein